MKKKVLLLVSTLLLIVILSSVLFACSSETRLSTKSYNKQVEYYEDCVEQVQKCESTLNELKSELSKTKFKAEFVLERKYYSTSNNNIEFLGGEGVNNSNAGFDKCKDEDGSCWMMENVKYVLLFNNGSYKITASVADPIKYDDYDEDKIDYKNNYVFAYINGEYTQIGGDVAVVQKYCINMMYEYIFGEFTSKEFLEAYATSAEKGFRFYTSMMQYQLTRAYGYNADGTIDTSKVLDYTLNKDKLLFSSLEESADGNGKLTYKDNDGNIVDPTSDDVSFWDNYGEDISYNFYKTAEVVNDRITMTYSNSKKRIDSFEYYGEKVLPYYAQKSDFKTYSIRQCVVAESTHFVVNFDYEANVEL